MSNKDIQENGALPLSNWGGRGSEGEIYILRCPRRQPMLLLASCLMPCPCRAMPCPCVFYIFNEYGLIRPNSPPYNAM